MVSGSQGHLTLSRHCRRQTDQPLRIHHQHHRRRRRRRRHHHHRRGRHKHHHHRHRHLRACRTLHRLRRRPRCSRDLQHPPPPLLAVCCAQIMTIRHYLRRLQRRPPGPTPCLLPSGPPCLLLRGLPWGLPGPHPWVWPRLLPLLHLVFCSLARSRERPC